jgi:hypothetical protein
MSFSWKSREIVRLENATRVSSLGEECRREIDRIKQTMPRSGALQRAVDDAHIRFMLESLNHLSDSYVSAYAAEGQLLTLNDVEEIVGEMNERVQAMWQGRAELEPRSIGLGFHEELRSIVPRQRQKLILAMKCMDRDRELAMSRMTPVDQVVVPAAATTSDASETASAVTIQDVDAFELKPNIFGIGINFNHLIKRFGEWRKRRRARKANQSSRRTLM